MSIKNLNYEEKEIGAKIKSSKRLFIWEFELEGTSHRIELYDSRWSGKKKIIRNGRIECEVVEPNSFFRSFDLGGHNCTVIQYGDKFELRFDNQSFSHLLNIERNKNYFSNNSGPTSSIYTNKTTFQNNDQNLFKFENQIYKQNAQKDNKPALFNFSIKNKESTGDNHLNKFHFGPNVSQSSNNQSGKNDLLGFGNDNNNNQNNNNQNKQNMGNDLFDIFNGSNNNNNNQQNINEENNNINNANSNNNNNNLQNNLFDVFSGNNNNNSNQNEIQNLNNNNNNNNSNNQNTFMDFNLVSQNQQNTNKVDNLIGGLNSLYQNSNMNQTNSQSNNMNIQSTNQNNNLMGFDLNLNQNQNETKPINNNQINFNFSSQSQSEKKEEKKVDNNNINFDFFN